jgi:Flp pilus assembly pilin Flp
VTPALLFPSIRHTLTIEETVMFTRLAVRVLHRPRPDDSGQTTAEYALLTGAMALILGLVAAWATSTGKVGQLFDAVFSNLTKAAKG